MLNPNRRSTIKAQVHRLGDYVAIYIGTGETVYLSPKQARQFSRAINKAIRSCETEPFTESSCTSSFDFSRREES